MDIQQSFSDSVVNSSYVSESERSMKFVKPRNIFKSKNKSVNSFDVLFNATDTNSLEDELEKTSDEFSMFAQENPFTKAKAALKKKKMKLNESLAREESSFQDSSDFNEELDSTVSATRKNPFKKSKKSKNNDDELQISGTVENKTNLSNSVEDEFGTSHTSRLRPFRSKKNTYSILSISGNQSNKSAETPHSGLKEMSKNVSIDRNISGMSNNPSYFEQSSANNENLNVWMSDQSEEEILPSRTPSHSPRLKLFGSNINSNSVLSVSNNRNNKTAETSILNPKEISKNISVDRSVSGISNNPSLFEQSLDEQSNNENLNDWMSDQSDEQIPPLRAPLHTANLSQTREKPPLPNSPTVATNTISIWEEKVNEILSRANKPPTPAKPVPLTKKKPVKKSDVKKPDTETYKREKLAKPASFVTKRMYDYIIKRLKPKYGLDTMIESENIVVLICDTVKKVTRRKSYQKGLITRLKTEMAKVGLVETTMDFYEFVINFLPYPFRVKVVPCLQPVTGEVYPPREVKNPFDKIL